MYVMFCYAKLRYNASSRRFARAKRGAARRNGVRRIASHVCMHIRAALSTPADISSVSQVLVPSRVTRRMSGIPFRATSSTRGSGRAGNVLVCPFPPSFFPRTLPHVAAAAAASREKRMPGEHLIVSREALSVSRARHDVRNVPPRVWERATTAASPGNANVGQNATVRNQEIVN